MLQKILNSAKARVEKYSNYLIILILFLLALSLSKNILKVKKVDSDISGAREKLEKLKIQNKDLAQQLEKVKSDAYIEKQLRDKLGLAKEGEIVVILPDDETLKKLVPNEVKEEDSLPDPNWKKWIHIFGF